MTALTPKKTPAGNRRVTGKEQYYTPPELAVALVAEVGALVGDLGSRTVVEPAGGTGSFVDAAKALGAQVISFDIEPLHEGVKAGDFLQTQIKLTNAVTISNPPFGRNNSLSIPFFNHAAEFSEFIAFIVPRSWRKGRLSTAWIHAFTWCSTTTSRSTTKMPPAKPSANASCSPPAFRFINVVMLCESEW